MDEFQLDPDLHNTLRGIRESVRRLFEQLRLKHESGDVPGKDRLERVSALAKHNFANLAGPTHLAAKEAWRLIDFLEGNSGAQLSAKAREGLRVIELDKKLAALRASDRWKVAAARLRKALGASHIDSEHGEGAIRDTAVSDPGSHARYGSETIEQRPADASFPGANGAIRSPLLGRLQPPALLALLGLAIIGGLAALALFRNQDRLDPRVACLPLERASESDLDAHWNIVPRTPVPLPARDRTRTDPVIFTISDPDNGPVHSIFTTSQFSYEEATTDLAANRRTLVRRGATGGPGGGKADETLRVGGWGDTYLSLIKFPLADNRTVRRAVLRLVVLGYDPTSRPTTMVLRLIRDPWDVEPGAQHRLWWRDCPRSDAFARLPAPAAPESAYEINITEIYNLWARGLAPNYGIMLEPEQIGSYGSSPEHYPNLSTFYSTRALDPEKRPKLVLTY